MKVKGDSIEEPQRRARRVAGAVILSAFALVSSLGCASSSPSVVANPPAYTRAALRAPRPNLAPERKNYRPRLVLRDNALVRSALTRLLGTRRPFLEDALSRDDAFRGTFNEIFIRYGLPVELANLAIVESRLVPTARSRRGAVGLWQFMPATARRFGLRVGFLRDERKDPAKSTEAAAKYLSYLYRRFDDWFLALAAYNCGPARLQRIIERHGTDDFFELAEKNAVSKETKLLVARFVAVTMILRNRETYSF